MSDLIDRQEALNSNYRMYDAKSGIEWIPVLHIKDLPSAEPERKKGFWVPITNGRGGFECDQCHNYAPSYQNGDEYLSYFCPNCGVRMEIRNNE